MITDTRPLAVIVEKRATNSPWQPFQWQPVAVLPGAPETERWTVLAQEPGRTCYFAGTAEVTLRAPETQAYKDNLEGPAPSVYVVLRRTSAEPGVRLLLATADPGEAQAHAEAGDDILEALPMPPALRAWLAAFVSAHHVERRVWKRKRDRPDPEALGGRPGLARSDEG